MNAKGFGQPIYKLNLVGINLGDEVSGSGVIVCVFIKYIWLHSVPLRFGHVWFVV
jgi:hypothetical protein